MGHYDEQRDEWEAKQDAEHYSRHGVSMREDQEIRKLTKEVGEYLSIGDKVSRLEELMKKKKRF